MKRTIIVALLLMGAAATNPAMAHGKVDTIHTTTSDDQPQQPLYIIDNRAVSLDEVEALAPSDIESITIVRDEDTQQYSHLGDISNGVIIITLAADTAPLSHADTMPAFLNGSIETFHVWVMQNMRYPAEMIEKGISATLIVQFVVNSDGYIPSESITFLQGGEKQFEDEVRRVLLSSPRWTPGMHEGKNVYIQFAHPVVFSLDAVTTIKL